jgi:hypothetical protein
MGKGGLLPRLRSGFESLRPLEFSIKFSINKISELKTAIRGRFCLPGLFVERWVGER